METARRHTMTASSGLTPAMVSTPCMSHERPQKEAHRAAVHRGAGCGSSPWLKPSNALEKKAVPSAVETLVSFACVSVLAAGFMVTAHRATPGVGEFIVSAIRRS